MKFKVGDIVRTVSEKTNNITLFPIGTIGFIEFVNENENTEYPYRVRAYNDYWYYSADMLELIDIDGQYEKGLNDAWNCARKIALDEVDGGLPLGMIHNIFDRNIYQIFHSLTASEAIKKIKEYEIEKTKEILIGDEVYLHDPGNTRVVISFDDSKGVKSAVQITKRGKFAVDVVDLLNKTGRHFPEIEEVITRMQEVER